jgi:hypothetical protein
MIIILRNIGQANQQIKNQITPDKTKIKGTVVKIACRFWVDKGGGEYIC